MAEKISLLLLTHNSFSQITKYFSWLSSCPNISEIVIVDDNSIDKIKTKLSLLFPKKIKIVFLQRTLDNFSAQRQFGLSHVSNPWVLWLDSDEKPSSELITFLKTGKFDNRYCYSFKRHLVFHNFELKYGESLFDNPIRLFPLNSGSFINSVHEIWQTQFPLNRTNYLLYHHSFKNITDILTKINMYSSLRSVELHRQGRGVTSFEIFLYPIAKFFQVYIIKLGFLDSTAGIVISLYMSFYSFLVRSKLWHLYHP